MQTSPPLIKSIRLGLRRADSPNSQTQGDPRPERRGWVGEGRGEGDGNRWALFISQLPRGSDLLVHQLRHRSFGRAGAFPGSPLVRAGSEDALSPGGCTPTPTSPSPATPFGPNLPTRVPHSQYIRGPSRGIAALARIALRSQLLPYSAQHDWGGGVSGSGEDRRG